MAEEKPDLVLLDLMLPGTDGIELMKDILRAGDDADNPTYIFTEPRVGYRMPKGEAREQDVVYRRDAVVLLQHGYPAL